MKTRTALRFLPPLLAMILLLTGCQGGRAPAPDETAPQDTESEAEPDPFIREEIRYRLVFDEVDYVSKEEKEAWRSHLIRRLSYIKGYTDDHLPEGEYAIAACQLYALFDLDLDGVPEILGGFSNAGSGYSSVYYYCFPYAFDLYTGRQVGDRFMDICNNLSVFYNSEKGAYEVYSVNQEFTNTRSDHVYGGTFLIDRVEVLYPQTWFPDEDFPSESDVPYITTTRLLSSGFSTHGMFSAETETDEENGEGSNRFVTVYRDPHFTRDGEPCEYYEFHAALLSFVNSCIRLPETKLQYISPYYGDDFTEPQDVLDNAEALADELLSLDQHFVRPMQRQDTPVQEASS